MKTPLQLPKPGAAREPTAAASTHRRAPARPLPREALQSLVNDSPRQVAQRRQLQALLDPAIPREVAPGEAELPMKAPAEVRQRQSADDEEEPLQGRFSPAPLQAQADEEDEPLQARASGSSQASAAAPNRTGMPDALKAGIESLSGLPMDRVRVHYNSAQPEQLNALAYAQGSDIHLAPGQEQHLPHEAWHVVQQAQGRVRPTMQLNEGVPVNDDQGLEREADEMGSAAVQMRQPDRVEVSRARDETAVAQRAGAASVASASRSEPIAACGNRPQVSLRSSGLGDVPASAAGAQAVLQRLPHGDQVSSEWGAPARSGAADSAYRELLSRLDRVHRVLDQRLAANAEGVMPQAMALLTAFDELIGACNALSAPGQDQVRALRALSLKLDAQNEKTMALRPLMVAANKRSDIVGRPRLREIVLPATPVAMNEAQHAGTVGGGMNLLHRYVPPHGAAERFFKPNMATMDIFRDGQEYLEAPGMPGFPHTPAARSAYDAKLNRTDFATLGRISAVDTRSASREVASYRLDQLLDAGLIARTEFALRTAGGHTTLGSVQHQARGMAAGIAPVVRDAQDPAAGNPGAYRARDPQLLRQLSRLQLLDTLAMQLDRHTGNYFVELNAGSVVRVTGIDNDMSFGTRTDVAKRVKQYSGMSRYVDKKLATRILTLDPTLLRAAMSDLLSEAELDALTDRLGHLQAHLAGNIHRLPDSEERWTEVAQAIEDEQRGYQYLLSQKANNPARGY